MEYKKLSELANIQSGLVLSRKAAVAKSQNATDYRQINLRSINSDGTINAKTLNEFHASEPLDNRFMTIENDILMRLFAPINPAIVTKEFSGLIVPSQFAIIRIKNQRILPAFLSSYLSIDSVLRGIYAEESGQVGRGIKISTLFEIPIPLLSKDKQKKISVLTEEHSRRKRLILELIHQYDIQTEVAINKAIRGEQV